MRRCYLKDGGVMMRIKRRKLLKIIFSTCLMFFVFSNIFAATTTNPTLVTKLNSALKKILGYLKTLSTPIASIALVSGVMIRKLSFGDEEKMVKGKKIIINAIIGYSTILCLDWIIKFLETILK